MLGSLLCPHGSGSVLLDPYGSTISETTSEAWSVEVLPSDSGTNVRPLSLHCRPAATSDVPRLIYGSNASLLLTGVGVVWGR